MKSYLLPPTGHRILDRDANTLTQDGDQFFNSTQRTWQPLYFVGSHSSNYFAIARPLTQDEKDERLACYMMGEIRCQERVEAMDNRELVWRIMHTPYSGEMPCGGPDAAFFDAIYTRLFPEWSADETKITEWGWQLPEGDIVYEPSKYPPPAVAASEGGS